MSEYLETAKAVATQKPVGSWLHIAAMNLIADHEAGVHVDPAKLELARKLVAQLRAQHDQAKEAKTP